MVDRLYFHYFFVVFFFFLIIIITVFVEVKSVRNESHLLQSELFPQTVTFMNRSKLVMHCSSAYVPHPVSVKIDLYFLLNKYAKVF